MTAHPLVSLEPIPDELLCPRTSSTACLILLAGQFLGVAFYLLSKIFDADVFICIAIALYAISVGMALVRHGDSSSAGYWPPAANARQPE